MAENVLPLCRTKRRVGGAAVKRAVSQIALHAFILFFLVCALFPLYLLIIKSVKNVGQDQMDPFTPTFPFLWDNYRVAWLNISSNILNSFIITSIALAGLVALACVTAFAFVHFKFYLKEVLFTAIIALMMIPGTLTLVSQYSMVYSMRLVNTYWGVILPQMMAAFPMSFFLLTSFFKGISRELFDAASLDGAPDMTMLFKIMLPLSMPIVATIVMTQFMALWNEYVWSGLILITDGMKTIPIALVSLTDQFYKMTGSYGTAFAAYVIASVPVIVIFAVGSKQFVEGMTSGAFKM